MKLLTTAGLAALIAISAPALALAQGPERVTRGNLVMENIPEIPGSVRERLRQYQNVRGAGFSDFAPDGGVYIVTRFGETNQIHHVAQPLGMRRQVTFYDERTSGASVRPDGSGQFVFARDVGGDEFFQGFLFDPGTARSVQFTRDQTRNQGFTWAPDGSFIAFASTPWDNPDYTIFTADPADPASVREVFTGEGAIAPRDISPDGTRMVIGRYISINETRLQLLDIASGEATAINPDVTASYGAVSFSANGESLFVVSDEGAEFRRILEINLADNSQRVVAEHDWDVQAMDLSPDGALIAYTINAGGISQLHIIEAATGEARAAPDLPVGLIGGVSFSPDGSRIGFSHSSAGSPGDAWSYELASGELTRWTQSEVGGLDTSRFEAPELVHYDSFDGLEVPVFVHRPEGDGPHPVIISIHGG
ncbi:MAG: hypothetical protein LAT81_11210, partial [Oceanicaulis sp.]|nr:hypothetical protein [Oceanicaulis sp.]